VFLGLRKNILPENGRISRQGNYKLINYLDNQGIFNYNKYEEARKITYRADLKLGNKVDKG